MANLSVAIDANETPIILTAPITVGSLPAPYTLDSENVLVTGGSASAFVSIERGANGTAPASHAAGTALVAGWSGPGGDVDSVNGQTGVVVLDAGDIGVDPAVEGQTDAQAALSSLSSAIPDVTNLPTNDEKAALDGAASPGAGNVFATMADVPSTSLRRRRMCPTWPTSRPLTRKPRSTPPTRRRLSTRS